MRQQLRIAIGIMIAGVFAAPAMAAMPGALFLDERSPATQVKLPQQEKNGPVTLNADTLAADHEEHIFVAQGNVEVMQDESILNAQKVTYYQDRDLVVAEGGVSVLQPSGDVLFADKAELKDAMKRAVIENFKARLSDNAVMVANRATRPNSKITRLEDASYTPCHVCEGLAPLWQVNAKHAEVNDIDEMVRYHDATMEMFGVPVFYTPYLSHPTPSASAKSGFLTPTYGSNQNFGTLAKIPYYWRIGEDRDVLLTPWITSDEGPLLQWDYHQLRNAGDYTFSGSITNPRKRDDDGNVVSGRETRWHLFASGDEAIADDTHAGFDIQRASDDTYLRRYGFNSQSSLFSRAYVEEAHGRNYLLGEGLAIQGLRNADDVKTTPYVFPALSSFYETTPNDIGLRYNLASDAQWLNREEGADQARISLTPGMTLPMMTEGGHLFTSTLRLREDVYYTDNLVLPNGTEYNGSTTRTLPQAALEWRYPLVNNGSERSLVLEPIALGVLQPNGSNPDKISNEDSRLLELSDTNIFSLDRMPGLDLYDSGSRVAYGVRSQYYEREGLGLDGMLGQNYSVNSDTPFPNSTDSSDFSDYIGRLAATYDAYSATYRFALAESDFTLNRNEITLGVSKPWFSGSATYLAIRNNRYLPDSKEGLIDGSIPLSENWDIYGNARRDLNLDQMVDAAGGIIYKNECFNIILDAKRVYTRDRDVPPSTEYTLRVGFKNLGEFGGN